MDEDKNRLFDTLDEIKREIAVLQTEVSLIKKVIVGNGQEPLEKRLTTLESELKQIQSQSAKSWQFIVAISAAVGSVVLTFILNVLR
jgi:predicted Rossmann-fold nucleotide-binding protein